jgi:hypothetical protein
MMDYVRCPSRIQVAKKRKNKDTNQHLILLLTTDFCILYSFDFLYLP